MTDTRLPSSGHVAISGRMVDELPVLTVQPSLERATPTRNLLIVHWPGRQDRSDWDTVVDLIRERAPDIEARILTNGARSSVTRRWQESRPSLVFSPSFILGYQPRAGKIYAGRRMRKMDEMRRLQAAGLPVPEWVQLTRGLELDPAVWGAFVVVKPNGGVQGKGVRLIHTVEVPLHAERLLDGNRKFFVQRYVDNRDAEGRQYECRVTTVFGKVLWAEIRRTVEQRRELADLADNHEGVITIARGVKRNREFVVEPEALALGLRLAAEMAEFPVLGADIVRDRGTGILHVLETNPGGDVWHLSSNFAKAKVSKEDTALRYAQYGALSVTADALIERTRAEAA